MKKNMINGPKLATIAAIQNGCKSLLDAIRFIDPKMINPTWIDHRDSETDDTDGSVRETTVYYSCEPLTDRSRIFISVVECTVYDDGAFNKCEICRIPAYLTVND